LWLQVTDQALVVGSVVWSCCCVLLPCDLLAVCVVSGVATGLFEWPSDL
jgi:hypothetical protein